MNESIIKEIGRSYIISSLIPATFAVLLAVVVFSDLLEKLTSSNENFLFFEGMTGLLITFTFWLGFALYSAQDPIVKLFEGYYFERLGFLRKAQQKQTKKIQAKIEEMEKLLQKFRVVAIANNFSPAKLNALQEEIEKLRASTLPEIQEHEIVAPFNVSNLLPTRLGNVLRASESYANERYGIDGLTLWPRLAHILPAEFTANLEEQNNKLMFLLNSSFLAFTLSLASFTMAMIQLRALATSNLQFGTQLFWFSLGFAVAGYVIYRASVATAQDFSLFIRSGFDLYRFDLLVQLNQCLPIDLVEEESIWKTLHQFFISGQKLGPIQLEYTYNSKLKETMKGCVENEGIIEE